MPMMAMGVGMVWLSLLTMVTAASVSEPSVTSLSFSFVSSVTLQASELEGLSVLYLTEIEKGMVAPLSIVIAIVCLPGANISLMSWSLIAPWDFSSKATADPMGWPSTVI